MGLNLSERYLALLNLLLVIGLAYFAALAVNDVIAGRLAGEMHLAPVSVPKPPAAEQSYPRSYYQTVVDRDLFEMPSEEEPAAVNEDLHLKLLGTSLITNGKPYAIIEDQRTARQSLYRLDDDIPDAGKLVEVDPGKVFIERHGQRISLEIPPNPLPAPPPSGLGGLPVPHPGIGIRSATAGIRRMGMNRFVLDRSTVQANLQNMMGLFTQMRAVPDLQDGRSRGFKLSEIQDGSVFQQIGLNDGDVVTSIEGRPLTDPTQAMQLLSTLRDRQSISLSVLRNGRPMQLQYQIQ